MIDDSWGSAFRVFVWGFGSVYVILTILMCCVRSMSGIIRMFKKD